MEAQDNLLCAKISQAVQANKFHTLTFPFSVGGRVQLSTLHCCHKFQGLGEKHIMKFMPRFDGLYAIIDVNKKNSMVTLDLPNLPNIFPTFHTSEVMPYVENDAELFPNRKFGKPSMVTMEDGSEEYFIHNIIDE